LLEFFQYHKSVCKLSYVLFNIFTTLYLQGFCTAPEEEEADPNTKLQDNVSGTGIGEGEGNKDVSDQIEDEEDALGLKDDKPPPPPEQEKKPKEDEGMEMENDFEGTMHDIPDKEDKDNESESEQEEEEEDIQKVPLQFTSFLLTLIRKWAKPIPIKKMY
jgi:midasin (ATPase involved in ribosome maturation)